ncbi:aminotransferase class I/II-fold pyridoxal phosphate-dependent enzyme [Streptomyces hoynatensis]|uniref:aminotransferase class I/II-fold pyridoxal phosphate-dependent enzyme n=1 Tax=Streptomyces hoynatensis TaxID=1141874 RepID=UPI0019D49147|nr:aminotransferase class I/II-fold pyridoxal phosphate-dependent enzyme [Streptomyces hoynatensis]
MTSRQAERLLADTPAIADAHFRAEAEPYDPVSRPGGYLNLGTAENRLLWDLVGERLKGLGEFTEAAARYAPLHGTEVLRERIAALLSATFRGPLAAGEVVVISGATGALDALATVLCDPGETIVVPAPYYGAFDTDLAGRSGARLWPAPLPAAAGFRLTAGAVDRALTEAKRAGAVVRAVALSSPSNPMGEVTGPGTLAELLDVVRAHDVDLISDEIYAHAVFGPRAFTSALDPAVNREWAERTHVVWGFAKDFALPGWKAGVLCSHAPRVLAAARALAYFAPVSTVTQDLLAALLADPDWVRGFLAEGRRRLAEGWAHAAGQLDAHGIPYVPAEAGFSTWVDLRRWLPDPEAAHGPAGFAAEERLWRELLDAARVNILPGAVFHSPQPGWFRLCHTVGAPLVAEAVRRLAALPHAAAEREQPTTRIGDRP